MYEQLRRLQIRVARLERLAQQAPSAEKAFFDNPLTKSVREFAESKAISNDTETAKRSVQNADGTQVTDSPKEAQKDALLAPPPPSEIKEKPGGKEFSTLNQFVVDTEEKVKGVPKGFDEAPKAPEVKTDSEKSDKEIKQEAVKKVMRRLGYVC